MSMTTNMITLCEKNHSEFCFVVKPAPGSRRVNIVGYQQLHEIEQMLFVSNTHVLLRLRGGKTVTIMANGSIVPQLPRVQKLLEENSRVVGESQIYNGRKTVLLEQKYGDSAKQIRYVALLFQQNGIGQLVGIFDKPKVQMKEKIKKLAVRQIQTTHRILGGRGRTLSNSTLMQLSQQKVTPSDLPTISDE